MIFSFLFIFKSEKAYLVVLCLQGPFQVEVGAPLQAHWMQSCCFIAEVPNISMWMSFLWDSSVSPGKGLPVEGRMMGEGRWSTETSTFLLADGILELKRRAGLDIWAFLVMTVDFYLKSTSPVLHTHTHTHTHTHSLTHSLTHSHTHTLTPATPGLHLHIPWSCLRVLSFCLSVFVQNDASLSCCVPSSQSSPPPPQPGL